jgi:HupH hydrogenase expression protein, C-terminal conserved region
VARVSGLKDIPVAVIASPSDSPASGPSGNATAILHEIADLLGRLVSDGSCGTIDLHAMPLTSGDRAQLEEVLAAGEVKVTIDAAGPTEICETVYPGVWWIRHRNEAGESVAELIEVTACPEILTSQTDDVREGWAALRRRLDTAVSSANG